MGVKESPRGTEYLNGGLPSQKLQPPQRPQTPAEVLAALEEKAWDQVRPNLVYYLRAPIGSQEPPKKSNELPNSEDKQQKDVIKRRIKRDIKSLPPERKHDIALELELQVVDEIFGDKNDVFDQKRREKLSGVSPIKSAIVYEVNLQSKSYMELLTAYIRRYRLPDNTTEADLQEIHDEAIIFYGWKFGLFDPDKLK